MKYIDSEKLIESIEEIKKAEYENCGGVNAKTGVLQEVQDLIASLQQEQTQIADASNMEQVSNLEHWLAFFGMPKENIENCITQIAQGYGAIRYLEGVQHGAEAVNELSQQSPLPSNLDEAAIEWCSHPPIGEIFGVLTAFKGGAEWMAGQFEKIEGDEINWYSTKGGKDYCCGIKTHEPFEVPEGFYIRKKQ